MTPTAQATIRRITGTLVEAAPLPATGLYELALVGHRRLLGEVIRRAHEGRSVGEMFNE